MRALSPTSETRRYEKYVAWCAAREMKAAPFPIWREEVAKIPDYVNPNPFSYLQRQPIAVTPGQGNAPNLRHQ